MRIVIHIHMGVGMVVDVFFVRCPAGRSSTNFHYLKTRPTSMPYSLAQRRECGADEEPEKF